MTSSGSTPSCRMSSSRSAVRRSEPLPPVERRGRAARRSRSGSVSSSRPRRRRCSITSGTPPARKTRTVGWSTGPLGSTSTSRGTCRLTSSSPRPSGARSPAACAIAGMCSSRFVEPPNAAWTTIALRTAASVRMSRVVRPRAASDVNARAPSAGPCRARSAGRTGASAECGSDRPSASATTCDVAAVPRNWQPPPGEPHARQPSSAASLQRDLAVREAGADRLHLARVLALGRAAASRRRAPARRADRAARPAPSSSPAGPCRRSPRRARRAAWAASGSAGAAPSPRRCGTAGCRSCRACPACGRRTGRSSSRRTARRRARPAPRRPPA